jgi:hypothetical protein
LPLTTDNLRDRLAHQRWTSHNIRLNDELTTCPSLGYAFENDSRLKAIERMFDFTFGSDWGMLRIADLGSLEGGFALACARKGAEVLGLEARRANFDKLLLLKEHFDLPKLKFELGDVKDFRAERYGKFDAVLALGILYHLDSPVEWLAQVAETTETALVIDSHFAPADKDALRRVAPGLSALSDIEEKVYQGLVYRGRWFTEFPPNSDREANLWASYSNWRSFWLTKESLVRAVRDAGFPLVLEQHEYSVAQFDHLNTIFPRTLLVGLKTKSS